MLLIESKFHTPIGALNISHDGQHILKAAFDHTGSQNKHSKNVTYQQKTEFCSLIASELESYFNYASYRFNLPLKPSGTLFQKKVWNSLLVIPAGQSITYGELSRKIQTSPRAIGQACRTNPIPLFIPCHRIVGKNNLGGYMGKNQALSLKQALLHHEGIAF